MKAISKEQIFINCSWVSHLSVGDTVAVYKGREKGVDGKEHPVYHKTPGKIIAADNELGFKLKIGSITKRATAWQLIKLS